MPTRAMRQRRLQRAAGTSTRFDGSPSRGRSWQRSPCVTSVTLPDRLRFGDSPGAVVAGHGAGGGCRRRGSGDAPDLRPRARGAVLDPRRPRRRCARARPVRRLGRARASRRCRAGARGATFVDSAPAAIRAVNANLEALGARGRGAPRGRATVPRQRIGRRSLIRSRVPRPAVSAGGGAGGRADGSAAGRAGARRSGGRRERSPRPARARLFRHSTNAATATP